MAPYLNTQAPQKHTREARDADEHAHNLTNWQQEYDQLSSGRFYGRLDEIAMQDLQIFKEHTNRALRQQCNVWANSLWLGIPTQSSDCRINGLEINSQQLMCRPGSCDFELMTPEGFDIYGIVVKQHTLLDAAQTQGVTIKGLSILEYPRIDIPANTLKAMRVLLENILTTPNKNFNHLLGQDAIINCLLRLLNEETHNQKERLSYTHRKVVVDRVKTYITEHPDAPITMTELCEIAFVSRRTLQYSFETILGVNPVRFLRTARLNHVRRALSNPSHSYSVSEAAINWGFWHAGQFARDYKTLFGENPSETVKRAALVRG